METKRNRDLPQREETSLHTSNHHNLLDEKPEKDLRNKIKVYYSKLIDLRRKFKILDFSINVYRFR